MSPGKSGCLGPRAVHHLLFRREDRGHEATRIPLELCPAFEFRRRELGRHPWWGDVRHADRFEPAPVVVGYGR